MRSYFQHNGRGHRARARRNRFRPRVEVLEERAMPTAIVWANRLGAGDTFTPAERAVVDRAIQLWHDRIAVLNNDQGGITVNVTGGSTSSVHLGGLLGQAGSETNAAGMPVSGMIAIDATANGKGWYTDPNPADNAEFPNAATATHLTGGPEGEDLLTVAVHELGHVLGFVGFSFGGSSRWSNHLSPGPGNGYTYHGANGLTAVFDADGQHLSTSSNPNDLMNAAQTTGERFLISDLDLALLVDAYGYTLASGSNQPFDKIATTTTMLPPSPNMALTEGQAVTFTAQVRAAVPTSVLGNPQSGIVTFLDGSTMLGSAPLVNGQATLTTSFGAHEQNPSGMGTFVQHSILARYEGDGHFKVSDSTFPMPMMVTPLQTGAGPVTHVTVIAPTSVIAGAPLSVTVTALNDAGQRVVDYRGTVHLTSSDGLAILPADYTFTGDDGGSRALVVQLVNVGASTVTAADVGNSALTASATVQTVHANVDPPGNATAVAKQFTHSEEYVRFFLNQAFAQYVNRAPTEQEITGFFLPNIFGGAHFTDEQIEALFMGAPEYVAKKGGTEVLWIRSMYSDLLFRAPFQNELDYWSTRLAQLRQQHPTDNNHVTAAYEFDVSDEREGYRVQYNYTTYLNRMANAQEVNFWVGAFSRGWTSEDLAAGFVGSWEYYNAGFKSYGIADAWIQSAYRDVLHRAAGADEMTYWRSLIN